MTDIIKKMLQAREGLEDLEDCMVQALEVVKEHYGINNRSLSKCPRCGGIADNGHDREIQPNPYWCKKCTVT